MAKTLVKDYHGCGDKQCWCANAKKISFANGIQNLSGSKSTDPFHRGWWLQKHPEYMNVQEAQED